MRALIGLLAPPLCVACGADAGRAAPLCGACRAAVQPTPSVDGLFTYEGPAGALVRGLKFGGRAKIADFMAAQIAAHAPPGVLHGTIVPVPVHPDHRRRRGIDHVNALARALARRTGLGVSTCLARIGDPRPQVGRDRRERLLGPTIQAVGAVPVTALVLDDVVTTGATLAACLRALQSSGCGQITAIAYARTTAR